MRRLIQTTLLASALACVLSCQRQGGSFDPKYDSLFLGMSLGMPKQAFYDYCWELNRQKVVTHGPTNQSVEYRLVTEFDQPVMMRFYPNFHEDKVFEMPVTYNYEAWAPWNRRFYADSLIGKVLQAYKTWYGPGFKELVHPVQGTVYYKIDGKRRINLFIKDEQFVQAVFTDLRVEKRIKEEIEAASSAH